MFESKADGTIAARAIAVSIRPGVAHSLAVAWDKTGLVVLSLWGYETRRPRRWRARFWSGRRHTPGRDLQSQGPCETVV